MGSQDHYVDVIIFPSRPRRYRKAIQAPDTPFTFILELTGFSESLLPLTNGYRLMPVPGPRDLDFQSPPAIPSALVSELRPRRRDKSVQVWLAKKKFADLCTILHWTHGVATAIVADAESRTAVVMMATAEDECVLYVDPTLELARRDLPCSPDWGEMHMSRAFRDDLIAAVARRIR